MMTVSDKCNSAAQVELEDELLWHYLKTRQLGILDKLFGKTEPDSDNQASEQAVIVHFLYGIDRLDPLHQLGHELRELIDQACVGEYDGHEIAMDDSDGFLFMYGPNAELLFKTVIPLLEQTDFMKGAVATLRFGPPEIGVKEITVEIKG